MAALVCAALALLTVWSIELQPPYAVQLRLGLLLTSSMAAGYAALFLALLRTPVGSILSRVFAPIGRMALTNYLTATLLFVSVGTALGLRGSSEWTTAMLLGAGILAAQAIWSMLWLRAFRYGLMEWVWRRLTYWQPIPMRGRAGTVAHGSAGAA
jgi:uncharacterized membrane protein YeiB